MKKNTTMYVGKREFRSNLQRITLLTFAALLLCMSMNAQTVENGVLVSWSSASGEITIPQGVTKIANQVFKGRSSITAVNFNDELEEIGDEAFMNCNKINKFKFPNSLKKIGFKAFYKCSNLTTVMS